MRPIWIRKFRKGDPQDWQKRADYLGRIADKNLIDPKVLEYPATETIVAEKEGREIVYLPVQVCYVLESLGIAPDASVTEIAGALDKLISASVFAARSSGHGEIYWLCSDESTCKFAERHGAEKVNIPVYRVKV